MKQPLLSSLSSSLISIFNSFHLTIVLLKLNHFFFLLHSIDELFPIHNMQDHGYDMPRRLLSSGAIIEISSTKDIHCQV